MIREILIGITGSAALLAVDLFVLRWSGDSNGIRAAVAVVIFLMAFFSAKLLQRPDETTCNILSDNEVGGTMSVKATEVSTRGADKILSSNKTNGDFVVKVDKIGS